MVAVEIFKLVFVCLLTLLRKSTHGFFETISDRGFASGRFEMGFGDFHERSRGFRPWSPFVVVVVVVVVVAPLLHPPPPLYTSFAPNRMCLMDGYAQTGQNAK